MKETVALHTFVGLDIGTSKVKCVVGSLDEREGSRLSIIGHGVADNLGMRKGVVVHPDDVAEAISQAVNEAERISGTRIESATVNINGSHISGMDSKGVIAINAANREISDHDRVRVEEAAAVFQLPPNREIVQIFAKNYRVDGQSGIKDPVGMHGIRLEVDTHIVTVSTPNLRNLESALEKSHLRQNHRTASSLAAAEAVLNRQQRESGTLLLDIGAGTTNVAVIEDGEVEHVAVIPMGGIHITNDLAIGLKCDLELAEEVKIKHSEVGENTFSGDVAIEYGGETHKFESDMIEMITISRVEEILEYVDRELKKIHRSRKLPGGVVLTGGTSMLPGLDQFVRDKLQLAARVGELQSANGLIDTIQEPSFHVAIGLMQLDMLLSFQHQKPRLFALPNPSFFGSISGLINKIRHR